MKNNRPKPTALLSWTIWALGGALYLIGFYQRVAPAVITQELMNDFQIGATKLGHLSAFYFYSYVAMQAPTGILADRWGPRRLLSLGAFTAGVGSLVFALAENFLFAGLGRLLIGGSVAVAFVGMLKLANHWIAPQKFALASGMALFLGIIGAVFAGVPLRLLVDMAGWRPVMVASAAVTAGLAIVIWVVVRDDPEEMGLCSHAVKISDQKERTGVFQGLSDIFKYRNTWLLCLIPGGVVGCILTFSGLWGVPFLSSQYGLPVARSAALTSALLVAWAVGGPLFGALSDRIGRRKPLYVFGCFAVAACWIVLVFVPKLPVTLLTMLLLFTGAASGCIIIGFAFIKESVPPHLAGTVSGICNMGVMSGPMILQPLVGYVLDISSQDKIVQSAKTYSLQAYQKGFSIMIAWAVLGAVLILFTRETFCRQMIPANPPDTPPERPSNV